MKKTMTILCLCLVALASVAQTLNVRVGSAVYQFPAAQTGDMAFTGDTQLTVMGKAFTIADIAEMYVDTTTVTDNAVRVAYDGTAATVYVAGNVAQYVTPTVSGAHVSIAQSDAVDATVGEITYTLTGTATDGEFYLSGSYKTTVELSGVSITNKTPVYSGAAVHVQNGKRVNIRVATGTENTLADAATGSQKGCLYVKGHAEFKQRGTLNVYGNLKHAIKAGEYIQVKNCTINVRSAVSDGINCNEYFLMESGVLNMSAIGDNGIQCDLDGVASTGETTAHEGEDSGNIYITGGTVNITVTGSQTKGFKPAGNTSISPTASVTVVGA